SSSGYHRYLLVNNCIIHFSDWWLMGYKYYNDWGFTMWDLCNQFVAVAQTGGLVTLVCYIGVFKRAFGAVGTARKSVEGDRKREWFLWYLGAALFATTVGYFGTSTSAQSQMGWLCLLAFISTATFESRQAVVEPFEAPSIVEAALIPGGVGAGVEAEADQAGVETWQDLLET
ncbi:MAG TPA: hypothetical protein VGY31_14580, partial [Terriglobia bacterium]|nr:hypothetical protein [Terriglobia bacterium]